MIAPTRTRRGRPAAQRAHRARLACRRWDGAAVLTARSVARSLPESWSPTPVWARLDADAPGDSSRWYAL